MSIHMQSNKDHEALVYSSFCTRILTNYSATRNAKSTQDKKKHLARSDYHALPRKFADMHS